MMTPEQREARRLERERQEREYEEARERQRAAIQSEFNRTFDHTYTYRWGSDPTTYTFTTDDFFEAPLAEPATPSLNERLQAAIAESGRCAARGDNLGHLTALNTARRLRRELIQQTLTSTI